MQGSQDAFNVRAKRNGKTPGPGLRKCAPYLRPGTSGLPLMLRLRGDSIYAQ